LETLELSTLEFVQEKDEEPANGDSLPDIVKSWTAIATVEDDICLGSVPDQSLSYVCSKEETASHGGGVANLIELGGS
jgi:hypothetical protein